jgi:membrane-associated protease RseP (regulator of RpoE activity)
LHILLFLLTVGTTIVLGSLHYVEFASDFETRKLIPDAVAARGGLATIVWIVQAYWMQGLKYSASVLGILGAHEMGHYLACRRYDIDATLPFFLPFPSLSGTLGAVIRIREPFPTRTVLFDIAVWGPIAGFLVLVPVLFWGMQLSTLVPTPPALPGGYALGEPLLFKLATWVTFGSIPDAVSLNIHPMVFAAWFGMLATAWNLLPFGQFDGGHLMYASIGDASRDVSLITVGGCIGMCLGSYSWIVMTLVMLAMLYSFGPRHPRVIDDREPIGAGRYALVVFAILMFVLCFTPVPLAALP